tara:strand:- start:1157 stop:1801 length:645 start_codon:yes stop_codon:yes gene_type:complete
MKNELIKRVISSIILIPISFFIIIKGSIMFNFFLFIIFLLSLSEWIKMKNNTIVKVLGFLFLVLSFFSIYNLRNDVDEGFLNVIFVLIICISTDIGGFIFGKLFKGPKLTSISPNKTYSGILGSFLLTIIISTIFINVFKENFLNNNLILTYFFIILISSISQLGDLLISYFKRRSKLKDTGNIIPGHGGILDRIDGMIFAFPFSYILFYLNIN